MDLRFGPDDEDAFCATRDRLVESYCSAAEDQEQAPNGFVPSMMLEYKWGYGDGHITEWRRSDIEELPAHPLPTQGHDLRGRAPPGRAEVTDFLDLLDRRGLLSGDPLASLRDVAAALAPAFVEAVHDPTRFGMAKRVFAQMEAEGVDIEEQSSVDGWLSDFNARGDEERDGILGWPDPGPLTMPPIELPPIDELEGAAQASPVLSRLTAFARYVGPGRELTQQGYLTLADGRVLVDTLETGDRFDERIGDRVFNTRSTAELPRLDVTFRWARAAGFVKVTHGRVSATQRGDALGAKPVEDWGAAFDGLVKLESTGHSARRRYGLWFREACDWLVTRLPRMLYERSALGAGRLKDVLWAVVEATHYLSPDADVRQHQRRLAEGDVEHLLERFVELGAFTVADGRVSLTSLGLWGARSGRRG